MVLPQGAQALGQLHKATGRQTSEAALSVHKIDLASIDDNALIAPAKDRLGRAARFPKQGLIYVHGYNNSLEEIRQRHELLQDDLTAEGWRGVVVSFDWPSGEETLNYLEDRADAAETAHYLVSSGIGLIIKGQARGCQHLLTGREMAVEDHNPRTIEQTLTARPVGGKQGFQRGLEASFGQLLGGLAHLARAGLPQK